MPDFTNPILDLFLFGFACIAIAIVIGAIHAIGEWQVHRRVARAGKQYEVDIPSAEEAQWISAPDWNWPRRSRYPHDQERD